jgi:RNA polymerase sigma factor (sigma-70 family)
MEDPQKVSAGRGCELAARPTLAPGDALEALFRGHYADVFMAAYRVTGDAMDAEDALQTAFLRLASLGRERQVDAAAAPFYLRRAAVNASLDLLRARRRRPLEPLEGAGGATGKPGDDHGDGAAGAVEVRAALREALAAENPRSAEVFVLRYLEGYTNREIADQLDTSPSAIGVALHRTRARLREALGRRTAVSESTPRLK